MFEIELIICLKMDLALNNLQWLIYHKTQTTKQPVIVLYIHSYLWHFLFDTLSVSLIIYHAVHYSIIISFQIFTISVYTYIYIYIYVSSWIWSRAKSLQHEWNAHGTTIPVWLHNIKELILQAHNDINGQK